jgi:hypothetical protein
VVCGTGNRGVCPLAYKAQQGKCSRQTGRRKAYLSKFELPMSSADSLWFVLCHIVLCVLKSRYPPHHSGPLYKHDRLGSISQILVLLSSCNNKSLTSYQHCETLSASCSHGPRHCQWSSFRNPFICRRRGEDSDTDMDDLQLG